MAKGKDWGGGAEDEGEDEECGVGVLEWYGIGHDAWRGVRHIGGSWVQHLVLGLTSTAYIPKTVK